MAQHDELVAIGISEVLLCRCGLINPLTCGEDIYDIFVAISNNYICVAYGHQKIPSWPKGPATVKWAAVGRKKIYSWPIAPAR